MERMMTMKTWILLLFFVLVFNYRGTLSLRLREVLIPSHVLNEAMARLECRYDLEQAESLYSVKWYKDGNEFFRFVPKDLPPAQAFEVPGVTIDVENSTENSVTIGPMALSSSGKYRCEVSGEAPHFQTVSDHRMLDVVSLPVDGPRISGAKIRYRPNESIRMTCISGRSRPSAQLSWYINGDPASPDMIRGATISPEDSEGLYTSSLSLEIRALPSYFKSGSLKLKCLATIATIYWKSKEINVEGDKPARFPAMESRDGSIPGEERADRVQSGGVSTVSSSVILLTYLLVFNIFLYSAR